MKCYGTDPDYGSQEEFSDNEKKQRNKNDPICKPTSKDAELDVKVVGPLKITEVRWFYQNKYKDENSFLPFNGHDSLIIEMKYRWQSSIPLGEEFPGFDDALKACQSSAASVLNGYYEILISESLIKAIYWKEVPKKIARGTWFNDKYTRIEEYLCDYIEIEHLNLFTGCPIPKPLPSLHDIFKRPAFHRLYFENHRVEWRSAADVTLHFTGKEKLKKIWRKITRISEIRRIRRGYCETASFADGPLPVNHLLFIVHGIGQKRITNNVYNTNSFRKIGEDLLSTLYVKSRNCRPMFLPVEWRTSLKLDEDTVDSITPPNLTFLRTFLNATVMDLMYYCSPKYRSEVTDGFVSIINSLYARFLLFHPGFETSGEVSIVAHSLGSVIAFDVITSWSPLSQYEDFVTERLQRVIDSPFVTKESKVHLSLLQNVRRNLELEAGGLLNLLTVAEANMDHLNFHVQNLFCLGSPLAVFLALRGQKGAAGFSSQPPSFYNIFNVNDPVAYRLEPLIHPLYSKIRPIRIHRSKETQIPYSEMPLELYKKVKQKKKKKSVALESVDSNANDVPKDLSPIDSPINSSKDVSIEDKSAGPDLDFLSAVPATDQLPYRIDYTTKESAVDRVPYIGALMAHGGYWRSKDVVLFILTQLYGPPL